MELTCPGCGSESARLSRRRGLVDKLVEIVGIYALRCNDCHLRFHREVWKISDLIYAKCPRCCRMELGTWSEKYCTPSFLVRLKIYFGALRIRCERCRCNFASFRKVKHPYKARRTVQSPAGVTAEKEGNPPSELPAEN